MAMIRITAGLRGRGMGKLLWALGIGAVAALALCGCETMGASPSGTIDGTGSVGGPVYVRGYQRRDGTYVRGHTRRR